MVGRGELTEAAWGVIAPLLPANEGNAATGGRATTRPWR
jgi:hypothetical protein